MPGQGRRDRDRGGILALLGAGLHQSSERERGAVLHRADLAAHAQVAAQGLGQAAADHQSEAGAAVQAGGGGIDLGEGPEQAVHPLGRDTDPGVAHRHLQTHRTRRRPHGLIDQIHLIDRFTLIDIIGVLAGL